MKPWSLATVAVSSRCSTRPSVMVSSLSLLWMPPTIRSLSLITLTYWTCGSICSHVYTYMYMYIYMYQPLGLHIQSHSLTGQYLQSLSNYWVVSLQSHSLIGRVVASICSHVYTYIYIRTYVVHDPIIRSPSQITLIYWIRVLVSDCNHIYMYIPYYGIHCPCIWMHGCGITCYPLLYNYL